MRVITEDIPLIISIALTSKWRPNDVLLSLSILQHNLLPALSSVVQKFLEGFRWTCLLSSMNETNWHASKLNELEDVNRPGIWQLNLPAVH